MLEIVIETHSNKITYLVVLRLVRPPAVVFVDNGSVLLWRQQSQLSLQQYRIHGAWNCAAIINSPDNSECRRRQQRFLPRDAAMLARSWES